MQPYLKKSSRLNNSVYTAVCDGDIEAVKYALICYPESINYILGLRTSTINCSLKNALRGSKYHNYDIFFEICKLLLQNDVLDVNIKDCDGLNGIIWAIKYNNFECFELILQHKSFNQTIKYDMQRHKNVTFIEYIMFLTYEKWKFIPLIIKHGFFSQNWKKWIKTRKSIVIPIQYQGQIDFNANIVRNPSQKEIQRQNACKMLENWRSYLPQWSIRNHSKFPIEFNHRVFKIICVFNRLNKTQNTQISKDMKIMLIKYIAMNWKLNKRSEI